MVLSVKKSTGKKGKTQKKSDQLALTIREKILSKELRPGDPALQEKDIMSDYEVSKSTAREALKILESQGLINIKTGPKGGASVTKVSLNKANEMLWNYFFQSDINSRHIMLNFD